MKTIQASDEPNNNRFPDTERRMTVYSEMREVFIAIGWSEKRANLIAARCAADAFTELSWKTRLGMTPAASYWPARYDRSTWGD